ncbi:MAG: DeoR/GlpR transcriptional regulator [Clostridia bacterium]|nr:DeoR/GlpR transcriptional regulator [Clostridia bacterium]
MRVEERQAKILEYLVADPDLTVRELAAKLFVSEPTIRRDFTELAERGLLRKVHGGAIVKEGSADREIPFLLRENERSSIKSEMGRRAVEYVEEGMVLMLDGSTSAYHLVPYLSRFKDILVVTSGAKTAVSLAEANIRTFCTGGQMIIHSFSYIGEQAESFVRHINADLLFFSCNGLSDDGYMTERKLEEASMRRVMFERCRKKILLLDSSKFGKTAFYNMGSVSEIDAIVSDAPLPPHIAELVGKK